MAGDKNTENFVGIVIATKKVKEADLRVTILGATGLRNLTAVGVLKKGAKLTPAVQLFVMAEFTVIGHKITGAYVLETHHDITKDIRRYYLACAICDVVGRVQGAGFLLTVGALGELAEGQKTTREIFTEYFVGLLTELGYGVEAGMDINTAFARYLDIKIPDTGMYL